VSSASPAPHAPEPAAGIQPVQPLLDVRGLRVVFATRQGTVRAVRGLDCAIGPGEALGIVGESGCGKTVSALALLGLLPRPAGRVTAGQALFRSVDLLRLSARELREVRGHRIAMIFQDPLSSLNPVLTIGRQVGEALQRHKDLGRAAARRRSAELLSMVGIPDAQRRLDDYPHQFSGGMRQRVMIAMAISCDPDLLIADEPTTALDVTIQAQILDLLQRLRADLGMALLLITHDLGVVAGVTDRICVMYAGRVVETGPSERVLSAPRHPYTLGLLRSLPRLDRPRGIPLVPIEGAPPDLGAAITGCPFRPRCAFAIDRCVEDPPLIDVGRGQSAACWVRPAEPPIPATSDVAARAIRA
jgi:oligopeptide/dipeptide ABC transporter ATP-binding protein